MNFKFSISTERLLINPLNDNDGRFILELLNTDGWIKFIGQRHVNTQKAAAVYIQKILDNKDVLYWVVKIKGFNQPIGIVTYIKRAYLEYHDIGFAFLPEFSKCGYAYEATNAVLNKLKTEHKLHHILATTMPENKDAITLLEKIGLRFENEIEIDSKKLLVYGYSFSK
ncbi:MAG: GNAT family N-acetyltransferase [Ferruginibacter sp.]